MRRGRNVLRLDDARALRELDNLGNVTEGETRHGVGASVVDGDAAGGGVVELGTGEADVGHVAHALVRLLWRDEVRTRTVDGFPRLFEVEQSRPEAVDVTVAGVEHAVIEQQPALAGLHGDGAGAYLHALPGTHLEGGGRHHVTVAAPEHQVGRLAVEDVAKGRVTRVAGSAEHGKVPIDLAGEEHAVAVVRQEGILQLVEGDEVVRPGHADGGSVIAVAPGDIVAAVDAAHAGVVTVHPLPYLGIVAREAEWLLADVPFHAVVAEAHMEHHAAVGVVAAEDAGKAVLEGYDGTVEDAVARRQQIARDDGVGRAAPHHVSAVGRPLFPRHVGQCGTCNFQIVHILVWF
jgi:hypothetical protein